MESAMMPEKDDVTAVMEKAHQYGQGHVFKYWDELNDSEKQQLLNQIKAVDFELLRRLADEHILEPAEQSVAGVLEPAEIIPIPDSDELLQKADSAGKTGEKLLRDGKVAALLVSGGQGTRLGFDGPKGKFPAGPLSNKTLFQLHAEKIIAMQRRYKTTIPWYIMTSETNDAETREFFEENKYFGLNKKDVIFFTQRMIPAMDENGKFILDSKHHIFTNPNGHGGTLFSLYDSGSLADMKKRGVEEIFYFQVDNVLLRMCDPVFLGYHVQDNAEMSSKVVPKKHPMEKVGVLGIMDGRLSVVEYSDLSEAEMKATNPDGSLKYDGGNIAIHILNLKFVEELVTGKLRLPYHVAHKKIPYLDEAGQLVEPKKPNGYKFEMFIFDALPFTNDSVVMEVVRDDEFSPIKNATGDDSPATAKQDLMNHHARMLTKAGVQVPFDSEGNVKGSVEISSLFALDERDLKEKIDKTFVFRDNLFLE
ncbi:UDPGP type 1 family protein [candidate division KSB1 bacterium]|nr:UDPGP type 1 family protein [candidate division KSB1 bacterium]